VALTADENYLHPVRNGFLLLVTSSVFLVCSVLGRRFYFFGLRLPDRLWATVPWRIFYFVLGGCFLLGAIDQLLHIW
jgi:hypothetical protein